VDPAAKVAVPHQARYPLAHLRRPYGLGAPTEHIDGGHPLNLWSGVAEILAVYPEAASEEPGAPIVIEVGAIPDPQSAGYWKAVIEGFVQPEAYTTDSLGYDVADRYHLSGLSNCGLSAEEIGVVRKQFAAHINPFGLFSDPLVAADFRASCGQLVPEHAPFCVYRIRRIKLVPRGIMVV
jgi:hypothetical protein